METQNMADAYVYICFNNQNQIGVITKDTYKTGNYILLSFDGITIGDRWAGYESELLEDIINQAQRDGFIIYSFNNMIDACKWVAKNY